MNNKEDGDDDSNYPNKIGISFNKIKNKFVYAKKNTTKKIYYFTNSIKRKPDNTSKLKGGRNKVNIFYQVNSFNNFSLKFIDKNGNLKNIN